MAILLATGEPFSNPPGPVSNTVVLAAGNYVFTTLNMSAKLNILPAFPNGILFAFSFSSIAGGAGTVLYKQVCDYRAVGSVVPWPFQPVDIRLDVVWPRGTGLNIMINPFNTLVAGAALIDYNLYGDILP